MLLLSTAYAPPIQFFAHLFRHQGVCQLEARENFVKQTYRNRCHILAPQGIQALTIPVEKGPELKTAIKDVRISDHGQWRHLHSQALISSYGSTPFFEFYWDDLAPFYEKRYEYLWDYNKEMIHLLSDLLEIDTRIEETTDYVTENPCDYRYAIRPKHSPSDPLFIPHPYYQVLAEADHFHPNLSILDLLFNMGPEAAIILRKSIATSDNPLPSKL